MGIFGDRLTQLGFLIPHTCILKMCSTVTTHLVKAVNVKAMVKTTCPDLSSYFIACLEPRSNLFTFLAPPAHEW